MGPPDTPHDVIVGIDGSPGSRAALTWAADPAKALGAVRTVTAYSDAALVDGWVLASSGYSPDIFRDAANEQAVDVLRSGHEDLIPHHRTLQGAPGRVLVDASADSDLLVVGCRGRSAMKGMLLGSVGSYCMKHSKVPVAVVPGNGGAMGPIHHLIVGVDGSANSRKALRWALDHVQTGGHVTAMATFTMYVHAFEVQSPTQDELTEQLTAVVKAAVEKVGTEAEAADVIDIDVHLGDPRLELERAALHADALVIGARGHRGVSHLLLGSVTSSLVHQPTSVTIVVPG